MLHTREANLSRLMRHMNGVYTQYFNRRHGLAGHVFQGRFKAILEDRDAYLLALCRYVERNPVAAKMVAAAADWPWSSYRANVCQSTVPDWLESDGLHGYLIGKPAANAQDRRRAAQRYAELVAKAHDTDASFWQQGLRGQVFLGDEAFAAAMQARAAPLCKIDREVPKAQRLRPGGWPECLAHCDGDRDSALHLAYRESGMTMTELAQQAGLSVSHISRLIAAQERLDTRGVV